MDPTAVPTLPEKAVALSEEGFYLLLEPAPHDWRSPRENKDAIILFKKRTDTEGFIRMLLGWIVKPELSVWAQPPFKHKLTVQATSVGMGVTATKALSAAFYLVAQTIEKADEELKPLVEELEAKRAEREKQAEEDRKRREEERRVAREQWEKERRQAEARTKSAYEAVRWMLDQKFKLRRAGYKSTVFGTVRSVSERSIFTISEKNIPMTINLRELESFHVKYEGDRKYTEVWTKAAFEKEQEEQEVKDGDSTPAG